MNPIEQPVLPEKPVRIVDGVVIPLTDTEIVEKRSADMQAAEQADRQNRLSAIDSRLAAIDVEAMRPLRAITAGTANAEDVATLAALEAEAQALRDHRSRLLAVSPPG